MAANQKKFTITPVEDADGIAQSQTPAAGGVQSLTLNGALVSGGIATFSTPQQVSITSAGDDTGRTFTITGIDERQLPRTEEVTGANAAAATSTYYFLRVDSVTVDDDTAGAVTAGTTGVCVSPWYVTSLRVETFSIGFSVELSSGATLTYSVEHTLDDLQDADESITVLTHDVVAAQTTNQDHNYAFPCRGLRCKVTDFTSGTAEMNIIQARH